MKSAEMVKKIRLAFCLEQKEFGELMGISKQAIWQYERGMRRPRLQSVRKLLELAKKKKIKAEVEDFID